MILGDEQIGARFREYARTAWRFECQPVYTIPREQPGLQTFLSGEPMPPGHNERWHSNVRGWIASGKSIGRVRTVRQPLTDYQRYQLAWGIPGNVEAGEDIRILDLTDDDLGLPNQDFWLFDDSIVVHLNFRGDGTLINREQLEEPDLAKYRAWQDVAVKGAVPFAEYAART